MMTATDWMFACVVGLAAVCAVVCGIAWKRAYDDGWRERGMHDASMRRKRRLERQREDARKDEEWLGVLQEANDAKRLAATGELSALDTPPGRVALPRDTGAIELMVNSTSRFIEQMTGQENRYRKELAS